MDVHVYKRKQFVLYTVQYISRLSLTSDYGDCFHNGELWSPTHLLHNVVHVFVYTSPCSCYLKFCEHVCEDFFTCKYRNVHEQSTCINFEIFIFMGFRLSVKLLLIVRNNLWVVGEILIHFVILCFNSLPHYQSMLMQTPEKGGDCVERWLGLEFWWSLRNPSKNLSLTFV